MAAATRGFCKAWYAACTSMHAVCASRRTIACMAPTSAGADMSSRWTTAATPTTWEVRCQWVLWPQDVQRALHKVGCLSPCIRRCASLLTFRQQHALSQQLQLLCSQRRNGFMQLVQLSLI